MLPLPTGSFLCFLKSMPQMPFLLEKDVLPAGDKEGGDKPCRGTMQLVVWPQQHLTYS